MKLISLSIQNMKRIKAAELDFDGKHLVEVRGRNGAGKSTVIDSILYLLKGGRSIPAGVVTNGEEKGVIVGKLGEYTVRRVIDKEGKSTLTVESDTGKVPKPQEFLDKLAGQFLDPEYFRGLPSMEKRRVVLAYAGIDFSDVDRRIAEAEQNRLMIGREMKSLGAVPPEPENAEEVSVSGLLVELNRLNELNKKQDELQRKIDAAFRDLKSKAQQAIDDVATMDDLSNIINNFLPALFKERSAEMVALGSPEYWDTEDVQSKIANAETINTKARAYAAYLEKKESVESKKKEYDAADEAVGLLREEKLKMVTGAKMPIRGLGITDTGLTFNGVSDENWSDSESLKIALNIAIAYSGELKAAYIKRGEALDAASLEKLRTFAETKDFQVIMEVVDDTYAKEGDGVIYIDDGSIVE